MLCWDNGDCDLANDDIFSSTAVSIPEQKGLVLAAMDYDDVNGFDPNSDFHIADSVAGGVCEDHGLTKTRFLSGVATACFTYDTTPTNTSDVSEHIA